MKLKTKKWIKKHLNLYTLGITGAVILIIISLVVIFVPFDGGNEKSNNTTDKVTQTKRKKINIIDTKTRRK